MIWSLVQKPGAFARHRYREEFFPTLTFRRAYDAIAAGGSPRADLAYLKLLFLAAATSEADVETALDLLLDARRVPDVEAVKEIIGVEREAVSPPVIAIPVVELESYDELLSVGGLS